MRYRRLGRTGWEVSEVGLGTYPLGGALHTTGNYWSGPATYGAVTREEAVKTLRAGLVQGLNFIDTAPVYGKAELFLAEALGRGDDRRPPPDDRRPTTDHRPVNDDRQERTDPSGSSVVGRRSSVVARCYVATKCGEHVRGGTEGVRPMLERDFSRAALRASLEASRRRLGMERLDLVLLHSPGPEELAEDPLGLLVELRDRGEIAHIGVSAQSVQQAIALIEQDGRAEVLQVPFNLLQPEAAERLLPLAAERGVGIVVRTPLASGFLTGEIGEDHVFAPDDYRSLMPREQVVRLARQAGAFRWLIEEGIAASLSEAALRYVLSFPQVSTVIPGAMSASELERNLAVSDLGPLPAAAMARIRETQPEARGR